MLFRCESHQAQNPRGVRAAASLAKLARLADSGSVSVGLGAISSLDYPDESPKARAPEDL